MKSNDYYDIINNIDLFKVTDAAELNGSWYRFYLTSEKNVLTYYPNSKIKIESEDIVDTEIECEIHIYAQDKITIRWRYSPVKYNSLANEYFSINWNDISFGFYDSIVLLSKICDYVKFHKEERHV